jgi:hypothetical protein
MTEEEWGMFMSPVLINVCMCRGVGEKGVFGVRQGLKNWAVDSKHGTGTGRSLHSHTKGYNSK